MYIARDLKKIQAKVYLTLISKVMQWRKNISIVTIIFLDPENIVLIPMIYIFKTFYWVGKNPDGDISGGV